jgi:hypothetical protein
VNPNIAHPLKIVNVNPIHGDPFLQSQPFGDLLLAKGNASLGKFEERAPPDQRGKDCIPQNRPSAPIRIEIEHLLKIETSGKPGAEKEKKRNP